MAAYPGTNETVTITEVVALAAIKDLTNQVLLQGMIAPISRAIENYCRRRFLKHTWTQWVPMDSELQTDQWPINTVLCIGVPYNAVLITDTTSNYSFQIIQQTGTNLTAVPGMNVVNVSALTSQFFDFATYTTLGALKTAVEAACAGVTFAYQVVQPTINFANVNTLALRPTTGNTLIAGINYFGQNPNSSWGDVYRISDNSDRIIVNPNFAQVSALYSGNSLGPYTTGISNIDSGYNIDYYNDQDVLLIYDAGWTTAQVPSDLKFIVSSIIRDAFQVTKLPDAGLSISISVMNYSASTFESSKIGLLISEHYKAMLQPFMKLCL